MGELFQVFRTGTHTDSAGVERTFTAADLQAIADKFDAEIGPVPIVKGHPAHDDPAFGWIKRFMFEANTGILYAVPDSIDPGFKAEVEAKRYRRISIALYGPEAEANPIPGMFYPRHVGFLGASAPAVKGLKAVNFKDDEDFLMFENADDKSMSKFAEILGATLVKLGFKAAPDTPPGDAPKVEDSVEFKAAEQGRKDAEAALQKTKDAAAKAEAKNRRAGCLAFCKDLQETGKISPAEGLHLVEILYQLGVNPAELTFGEGDDEVKITPLKALSDFLSGLPVRIDFGELSGPGEGDLSDIRFLAPAGKVVANDRMDLHARIHAYSVKHGIPYIEAVSIVEGGSI